MSRRQPAWRQFNRRLSLAVKDELNDVLRGIEQGGALQVDSHQYNEAIAIGLQPVKWTASEHGRVRSVCTLELISGFAEADSNIWTAPAASQRSDMGHTARRTLQATLPRK